MLHPTVPLRRPLAVLTAAALAIPALVATTPALALSGNAPLGKAATSVAPAGTLAAPNHTTVVGAVPSTATPNIIDGTVSAIHDAGTKVIAAGSFTLAEDRGSDVDIPRAYVLAFDKATGKVDTAFAPALDDEVNAVIAGPTTGTVYLAGRFNTVNGVTRRKVALVNVATGAVVTGFAGPAFNGAVNDIALLGGRLLVGGIFTTAGSANPRGGLASLNATTGKLDSYLTTALTENHNWDGVSGAKAGIGPEKLAVSPDGGQLVVIGNFKKADGVLHDQVVRLTLGGTAATITNWNTDRYTPRCAYNSFDSYMRDVAFSPDGSYFAIVTTGAKYAGTLCDTASRWETAASGTALQPTWVDDTGGDTLLSVAISEKAVYVGGHMRWMNNPSGKDAAAAGAVGRPSLAALDPANGLPLAWNPGRHPRGYGVAELYLTADGLWIGSDQAYIGNFRYRRERVAFFPLDEGLPVHATVTASLPGKVYLAGNADSVSARSYDGNTTVGAASTLANPDGTAWSTTKGAFWVGGTLFYAMESRLYRRTFDGTSFGAATVVDPYHDPLWDTVETDSGPTGQTYAGVTAAFYGEIPSLTGMFFTNGRLYYTLTGQSGLFWRWFTPDSGTVGADRYTVTGATGFSTAGAIFTSGGSLYVTNRSTGTLSKLGWTGTAPTGTATIVSGPAVNGVDWRARAVFVGP